MKIQIQGTPHDVEEATAIARGAAARFREERFCGDPPFLAIVRLHSGVPVEVEVHNKTRIRLYEVVDQPMPTRPRAYVVTV